MKAMGGCKTADILREVEDVVNTKAGGNSAAFDHVLIIMPTLNELVNGQGHTIKTRNPERLQVFKKLRETLAPMKYKMVIGPGDETTWGIKGNLSFDQMAEELYQEFSTNDIPVCSGLPLFRQLEKVNSFHFRASENNLKKFPAYLAASIELTMAIATLTEAAHCLEKPSAYAKSIKAAGGNFSAHDLRNKTETILPSHTQEIEDFMKKRDTKNKSLKIFLIRGWR